MTEKVTAAPSRDIRDAYHARMRPASGPLARVAAQSVIQLADARRMVASVSGLRHDPASVVEGDQ